MTKICDSDSHANCGGALGGVPLTIEAWVKMSTNAPSTSTWQTLFAWEASGSVKIMYFVTLQFGINYSIEIWDEGEYQANSVWNFGSTWSNHPLSDGAWHHIAFVHYQDGSQSLCYIDGTSLGSPDTSNSTSSDLGSPDMLRLFGNCVYGDYLGAAGNAYVEELRVWSDARTEAEINVFKDVRLHGHGFENLAYLMHLDEVDDAVIDSGPDAEEYSVSGFPAVAIAGHCLPVGAGV